MEAYQMHGAWICPNLLIHFTDNIQSHTKVIKELGICDALLSKAKQMQWTPTELKKNYNTDLAMIALKLGYIRISTFRDQFNVEYGIQLNDGYMQKIIELHNYFQAKLYSTEQQLFSCLTFDDQIHGIVHQGSSLFELIEKLKD